LKGVCVFSQHSFAAVEVSLLIWTDLRPEARTVLSEVALDPTVDGSLKRRRLAEYLRSRFEKSPFTAKPIFSQNIEPDSDISSEGS
jgi:hypothetical protein